MVERVVLPDTNDDIAKKAASRSVQARIGLGNANDRLAAARLVPLAVVVVHVSEENGVKLR